MKKTCLLLMILSAAMLLSSCNWWNHKNGSAGAIGSFDFSGASALYLEETAASRSAACDASEKKFKLKKVKKLMMMN